MKNLFLSTLMLAALTTACSNDETAPVEYGSFRVVLGEQDEVVVTRTATQLTSEQAANYQVTLKQLKSGSQTEYETKYSKSYSSIQNTDLTYPAGSGYLIEAQSYTSGAAYTGDGEARYGGSQSFSITAGTTTNVTVACEMVNSKISVVFDSNLADKIYDYKVIVDPTPSTSDGATHRAIEFNSSNASGKYAFFDAGKTVSYNVLGKKTQNGNEVTLATGSVTTVAKTNHKLNVKLTSNGQYSIVITVDDSCTDSSSDVEVSPY